MQEVLHQLLLVVGSWEGSHQASGCCPECLAVVVAGQCSSRAQVSASSPRPSILSCGIWGSRADDLCSSHSTLPSQSSYSGFLGDFEVPPSQLISPSVRWITRMWVPFLFHRSLSGTLVPSWFLLSLSFFFCSNWLCQEFLALFGGLSSPSIQEMFCASRFTCRYFFNVFVGEGEHDLSYSSVILIP